jgi:hypothetical protein
MQGLIERVVDMYHNWHMTQRDIAESLKDEGYNVSKSGVGRALRTHSESLEELKKAQVRAQALIEATNKTPRLDIINAGLQIAATKLLDELSQLEDFSDIADSESILKSLTRVSRAIGLAANVELNFERGRKAGLFEAEKKFDEVAKKAGINPDILEKIKREVFGLDQEVSDGPQRN